MAIPPRLAGADDPTSMRPEAFARHHGAFSEAARFSRTEARHEDLAALPLALPAAGAAAQQALTVIGAALLAWKALGPQAQTQRRQVLEAMGERLAPLLPGVSRRGAALTEYLNRTVPTLMGAGDPRAAALKLYRGLQGRVAAAPPAPAALAGPRGAARKAGGPAPGLPPPGRPPQRPPGGTPPMPAGPHDAASSPERAALRSVRAQLESLHAQWQRAPRAMNAAQIAAGASMVPAALSRRLDALWDPARPKSADEPELAALRTRARELDQAVLRYTVHQAVAGRERHLPETQRQLLALGRARLDKVGDVGLLRRFSDRLARESEPRPSPLRGAMRGDPAAQANAREWQRQAQALERARNERYDARHRQLPGADPEASLQATADRFGVPLHILRRALQPQGALPGAPRSASAAGSGAGSGPGAAGPRPYGSPEDGLPHTEVERLRFEAFLERLPLDLGPNRMRHLVRGRGADGQRVAFGIDPSRLPEASHRAYERLVRAIGEPAMNRLANALVTGHGTEVGLRALSDAWQQRGTSPSPPQPLTGQMLVDFGKVIFADPLFGTLRDLESLTGLRTVAYRDAFKGILIPAYEGLLHPTEDELLVHPWIDPLRDSLFHLRGLPAGAITPPDIEASAGFLESLRKAELDYDITDLPSPSSFRPWAGSGDTAFKDALAAREAFWLSLRTAGVQDADLGELAHASSRSWGDVVARWPELGGLDFAQTYSSIHASLRPALREVMQPFHPLSASAALGVEAMRIADGTFSDQGLRDALYGYLSRAFNDPRAVRAHEREPDFQRVAQGLALEALARKSGLTLPWIVRRLDEQALGWARLASRAPSDATSPIAALEQLVTATQGTAATLRASMFAQLQAAESYDRALLDRIAARLAAFGLERAPRRPSVDGAAAPSLHEAVLTLLGQSGVVGRLDRDPDIGIAQLLISPPHPGASRNPSLEPEQPDALAREVLAHRLGQALDDLCQQLSNAGYPTRWRYRFERER